MPSCIIRGCAQTWRPQEGNVIMHCFPCNRERIRSWLLQSPEHFPNVDELLATIIGVKANDVYRLCSKHFASDAYFYEKYRRRLRPNAIPTIFPEKRPASDPRVAKRKKKNEAQMTTASTHVLLSADIHCDEETLRLHIPVEVCAEVPFPSGTSDAQIRKPRMLDKGVQTDFFVGRKCIAVVTDSLMGKKHVGSQTMKGKSRGTTCKLLDDNSTIGFSNSLESENFGLLVEQPQNT